MINNLLLNTIAIIKKIRFLTRSRWIFYLMDMYIISTSYILSNFVNISGNTIHKKVFQAIDWANISRYWGIVVQLHKYCNSFAEFLAINFGFIGHALLVSIVAIRIIFCDLYLEEDAAAPNFKIFRKYIDFLITSIGFTLIIDTIFYPIITSLFKNTIYNRSYGGLCGLIVHINCNLFSRAISGLQTPIFLFLFIILFYLYIIYRIYFWVCKNLIFDTAEEGFISSVDNSNIAIQQMVRSDKKNSRSRSIKNIQTTGVNDENLIPFPVRSFKTKSNFNPLTFLIDNDAYNSKNNLFADTGDALLIYQNLINEFFQEFAIDVTVKDYITSYSVILYLLKLGKKIKLDSLISLEPELSMRLKTQARVVDSYNAFLPIAIEIENPNKIKLHFSQVLKNSKKCDNLVVPLGSDLLNSIFYCNIKDLPHLLVSGTTGSGKSVCLHSIILSLLIYTEPNSLRFILIDPKFLEFNIYRSLKNLVFPVINTILHAQESFWWLIEEMNNRYKLISSLNARNIDEYNNQVSRNKFIPYIVAIIDECADLALDSSSDFMSSVIKIAQKSRAAGIHIIICTQRPSVNIITGILKANIPGRIALQTASKIDSRIILDCAGAESLKGYGDMLFYRPGMKNPIRLQSPFVDNTEIEAIVKAYNSFVN